MVRTLAAFVLVAWVITGCYDVPKPPCGFACGPNFACPEDYTCIAGRCVLESVLSTATCIYPDAPIPADDSDALPPDANTAPRVASSVPHEFEDNVLVDTVITVTFNEAVVGVDELSFRLDELTTGNPVGGVVTRPDTTTAVFTPNQPLRKGVPHFVTLTSQIQDLDGFVLPFTQWTFSTEPDLEPPSIAAQTPAPGTTDFAIDGEVSVRFSEDMLQVDHTTFTVRDDLGGPVFGSVFFDRSTFTAFYSSGLLRPHTTYTVSLSGAITDVGGNPLANAPITWTFTTGADTVPPNLIDRSPPPGATNVNINSSFWAWFDEDVVGVSASTFVLRQGATVIPATVTYNALDQTAQIDPTPVLTSGTTYSLTLGPGITDDAGNPLAGAPITWTFTTTADVTPPQLINATPTFGATNVPLGSLVTARFSEDVKNVSSTTFTLTPGGGVVTYNATNRTATLVPSPPLAPDTTYTVAVTNGIQDLANNPLSNPQSWTFTTTADATAPTVMTTTPANGATGVSRTAPIVVLFDEPVFNVGPVTFSVSAGAGIGGTLASAMMGREWSFTPDLLPPSTTVTVTLTSGITDAVGNPLAGPVTFSFTTEP